MDKKFSKIILGFTTAFAVLICLSGVSSLTVSAAAASAGASSKPVVVVIDPGHGGTGERNLGAQYNGFSEKDLTLKVANAMKTELEKYDNVTVYLTRTADTFISLDDRAAFAKSVNADFMFSIHFNASLEHDFYGSEIWTSAFGTYYQQGYNFGTVESQELNKLGLYQKGIKSKLGSSGKDYYGIIRSSVARNFPCVIIEHAYLDHSYDTAMLGTSDFINKLGVADATAVAKYFKLKSSSTGADYSGYTYTSISAPKSTVHQDLTPPETCDIKVLSYDTTSRNILVEMTAVDSQSPVIYFSYSYDGGKSFCILQMWDRTKPTQSFNIKVPAGTNNPTIVLRAYNNFELYTESSAAVVNASF